MIWIIADDTMQKNQCIRIVFLLRQIHRPQEIRMLRQSHLLFNFWRNEPFFDLKLLHSKRKEGAKNKTADVRPERYSVGTILIQHGVKKLLSKPEWKHDIRR